MVKPVEMAKTWRFYGKILVFIGIPALLLLGIGVILIGAGLWMRREAVILETFTAREFKNETTEPNKG